MRSFRKPLGLSTSRRFRDRKVSRTGLWSISHSNRYPSWSWFSAISSAPITYLQRASTLEWSLYTNRGRIQNCHLPIGQNSLPDTIGKLFEMILLARIIHEISVRGLMRDELFRFRPRHSTSLQLACLVEEWSGTLVQDANKRSLPRRGQSFGFSLDRWPPLQANTPKLPFLRSAHNLIVLEGSNVQSVLPDGHIISSSHVCWCGLGWIDLRSSSVCRSTWPHLRNTTSLPSKRITALIATSGKPTLLVTYLESYINDLQR